MVRATRGRTEREDASEAGAQGLPYTVYFPDEAGEGFRAGDLEHAAPLPRVGDTVEYIDEAGHRRRYAVREVVHTLQTSAATRPLVRDETAGPNALPDPEGDRPEQPGGIGALRAGLPKVFLAPLDDR